MPQPQVGETRSGATETVRWDGSRWQQVQKDPASTPPVGFHPLDALHALLDPNLYKNAVTHPIATAEGFGQGAAQGAPNAARIAQFALPLATGGLSIPAQMAIGVGAQGVADLADRASGDASAPQTLEGFLAHAATGAIAPLVGGAVSKTGSLIDKGLELGSEIPGKFGTISKIARKATGLVPKMLNTRLGTFPWEDAADVPIEPLHGADAFRDVGRRAPRSTEVPGSSYREPAPADAPLPQSSVMHGSDQYAHGGDPLTVQRFGPETFEPASTDELPQSSILRGADQYAHGGDPRTVETYARQFGPSPEFQSVEPTDAPPRLVKGGSGEPATVESALDTVLKGLSNEGTSTSRLADTPSVRSMDRGNMANGFPRMSPEEMGRAQAGAFRTGANIPSGATPTEQLFEDDIAGPHFDPHDEAGYVEPGDVQVVDQPPMHAGQDVPSSGDVEDLVKNFFPAQGAAPTNALSGSNMPDSLKAIDKMFGPGSVDRAGQPFQATTGYKGANNLILDPQTDSEYFRQQVLDPSTPDDAREMIQSGLRQRLRNGQSALYQSPK